MWTDVIHKVATISEHVVELVLSDDPHLTLNGAMVAAEDIENLIKALQEAAPLIKPAP